MSPGTLHITLYTIKYIVAEKINLGIFFTKKFVLSCKFFTFGLTTVPHIMGKWLTAPDKIYHTTGP